MNLVAAQAYTAAAKSLQLCPNLCDPRDGSPPGSPIPGILQARVLEWGYSTDEQIKIQKANKYFSTYFT